MPLQPIRPSGLHPWAEGCDHLGKVNAREVAEEQGFSFYSNGKWEDSEYGK